MNLEEPITITVERTGGFAGTARCWSVSSASLDEGQKGKLRELLEDSKIFDHVPPEADTPQPDRFCYTITVQGTTQSRAVTFDETRVPETLQPLLAWTLSRSPR